MAYGVKTAKQNKKLDSANPFGAQVRTKQDVKKTPIAALATRIKPTPEPMDNGVAQDSKLQQALDENRNLAEQLAAKRNVRRASNRQLLSSSRSETLGLGE
jgi:hypothetical protein